MSEKFCQSCGMPMEKKEQFGTNSDGSQNTDYCVYCYKDGSFTADVTMNEMINMSLTHLKELFKNDANFSEAEALSNMKSFFPKLKRWLIKNATEFLNKSCVISLSAINENGYPRVFAVAKLQNEGVNKIYISTGTSSNKVKHFKANSKASICYFNKDDSITLLGNISIVTDTKIKKQLWQDWLIKHFTSGVDDPEYCILEFTSNEATIYIDNVFETIKL